MWSEIRVALIDNIAFRTLICERPPARLVTTNTALHTFVPDIDFLAFIDLVACGAYQKVLRVFLC